MRQGWVKHLGGTEANRAKKTDLITVVVLCAIALAIALGTLFGGGAQGTHEESRPSGEVTYQDYDGKKIGIATGTNLEAESFKHFPNSEYLYYDGYPNLITALENGAIDAFLGDEPALKSIHAQQPQID